MRGDFWKVQCLKNKSAMGHVFFHTVSVESEPTTSSVDGMIAKKKKKK